MSSIKVKSKCKAEEGMKALLKLSKAAEAGGITITKFTGKIN